ncbi:unnamed protein product [Clonostachys byssicola]|uniref:Nucleoside phosphorylase domain-containing protein n=1 Tax=Clonostachys byssicola TaxID=160290 RepID=A0A9N9UP83_9HYPO|nr:unnamed protein product [Clonostachys byssicola]
MLPAWINSKKSEILVFQGNYEAIGRLSLFAAELGDKIEERKRLLAYMPYKPVLPTSCHLPFSLNTIEVLRHIAIQALHGSISRPSVGLVAELVRSFTTASTCADWFKILETICSQLSELYIIFDLGFHATEEHELQHWLPAFQDLLGKVETISPHTIIRVMIVSCRVLKAPQTSKYVSTIGVTPLNMHPDLIRTRNFNQPDIPQNLWMELTALASHTADQTSSPETSTTAQQEAMNLIHVFDSTFHNKSRNQAVTQGRQRKHETEGNSETGASDHDLHPVFTQIYQGKDAANSGSKLEFGITSSGQEKTPGEVTQRAQKETKNTSGTKDSAPADVKDFNIAIYCALPLEADAMIYLFDKIWDGRQYPKAHVDQNSYTFGVISGQNIILVHLASMGKNSAAIAASGCRFSFPNITISLVVGICGGVPFGARGRIERVLGDVIISEGLVQLDLGRRYPGRFARKRTPQENLPRPCYQLRGFLARLKSSQKFCSLTEKTNQYLENLHSQTVALGNFIYEYPGAGRDVLFPPSYLHKHKTSAQCPSWERPCGIENGSCREAETLTCEDLGCETQRVIPRKRLTPRSLEESRASQGEIRPSFSTVIHIGKVGSGDTVMKSGEERERIAREEDIIAFEMEGVGPWEYGPCLIIKGICDYADCHKSKVWQNYAAAAAAACTKALLEQWDAPCSL